MHHHVTGNVLLQLNMVIIHSFVLEHKPDSEIFYVKSSVRPSCPCCNRRLKVCGSRKRKVIRDDGKLLHLIIRRLYCDNCQKIHHELPDIIVPHKHYAADVIEKILKGNSLGCFPGEGSTAIRLRAWFMLLREYFEQSIKALKFIHKESRRLTNELSSLIPLNPTKLAAGWLKHLVRILVNSSRWQQTRFA